MGKRFKRCILVFMLLICKSLSWKSPCLPLTATRNVIFFPSLIEDAYSTTPGLQYWRRMGDLDLPVLLEMGCLLLEQSAAVGGLLASLCLQEEVHLAAREKHRAGFNPGNFKLKNPVKW